MDKSATQRSIVKEDHGEMNNRLLSREVLANFSRVESATRKISTPLASPEGKRLFLRYFMQTQLNIHYISVIARLALPSQDIEKIEAQLLEAIAKASRDTDLAIVDAEKRCGQNGILTLATYDIEPLTIEARVASQLGRRLLELIVKIDQLMPMLETLCIDDVISNTEMVAIKSVHKHSIRRISGTTRNLRAGLHKRINQLEVQAKSVGRTNARSVVAPASDVDGIAAVETERVGVPDGQDVLQPAETADIAELVAEAEVRLPV